MQSKDLITYKYQEGVYSIIDLINLTIFGKITQEDFFDITRLNFSTLQKKELLKDENN